MNTHKNARLTPAGRLRAVARVKVGESVQAVAVGCDVSRQTVYKWVRREAEGTAITCLRSTAPCSYDLS